MAPTGKEVDDASIGSRRCCSDRLHVFPHGPDMALTGLTVFFSAFLLFLEQLRAMLSG